jgi:hypothetical protein
MYEHPSCPVLISLDLWMLDVPLGGGGGGGEGREAQGARGEGSEGGGGGVPGIHGQKSNSTYSVPLHLTFAL